MLNRAFFSLQMPWGPTQHRRRDADRERACSTPLFYRPFGVWGIPFATSFVNVIGTFLLSRSLKPLVGPFVTPRFRRAMIVIVRRVGAARRGVLRRLVRPRHAARTHASRAGREPARASGARRLGSGRARLALGSRRCADGVLRRARRLRASRVPGCASRSSRPRARSGYDAAVSSPQRVSVAATPGTQPTSQDESGAISSSSERPGEGPAPCADTSVHGAASIRDRLDPARRSERPTILRRPPRRGQLAHGGRRRRPTRRSRGLTTLASRRGARSHCATS